MKIHERGVYEVRKKNTAADKRLWQKNFENKLRNYQKGLAFLGEIVYYMQGANLRKKNKDERKTK